MKKYKWQVIEMGRGREAKAEGDRETRQEKGVTEVRDETVMKGYGKQRFFKSTEG